MIDADGVYRLTGPAKVFLTEPAAIAAIKANRIAAGDVLVLICRGPMGAGMEETYQVTGALRYLPFGKHVARRHRRAVQRRVDRRLHRPCLAGGAGRRTDRQAARRRPDRDRRSTARRSTARSTSSAKPASPWAPRRLAHSRAPGARAPDLAADPALPDDTRIWAALQDVSGGTWGGCVFDADAIVRVMAAGKRALAG